MAHARSAQRRLAALVRGFPALAILGPRQIGKSTIAQLVFDDWSRFDLEDPRDEARLRADPRFAVHSAVAAMEGEGTSIAIRSACETIVSPTSVQ